MSTVSFTAPTRLTNVSEYIAVKMLWAWAENQDAATIANIQMASGQITITSMFPLFIEQQQELLASFKRHLCTEPRN